MKRSFALVLALVTATTACSSDGATSSSPPWLGAPVAVIVAPDGALLVGD